MLIILLLIGIGFIVTGAIIDEKSPRFDGFVWKAIGTIVTACVLIAFCIVAAYYMSYSKNAERIEIYEQENKQIEGGITAIIEEYAEFEKHAYKEYSVDENNIETIIMKYPELKTSELIQAKMKIYTENKQEIKKLKVEKVDQSILAWWLYFGK